MPAARAQRINFIYSGSLVTFKVPKTAIYQIVAFGAQGGSGLFTDSGGLGAEIGGNFSLTEGEVLQIAVGGAATPESLGGGRGSFVVGPDNTLLVIAGGGGGSGAGGGEVPIRGQGGLTGPNGGTPLDGTGGSGGAGGFVFIGGGGTGGKGGGGGLNGGGGGFFSAGGNSGLRGQLAVAHSRISQEEVLAVASAAVGEPEGRVVVATAAAAVRAPAVQPLAAAEAPSTRALTRSWSQIFRPATVRS